MRNEDDSEVISAVFSLRFCAKSLQKKINIEKECPADRLEYHYAADILPIPIDQRYGKEDMKRIAEMVKKTMSIKEE